MTVKSRRSATTPKPRRRLDTSLTEPTGGGKLSDAIKLAVVQRLAMFDSPQTVADAVKEEYGIAITRQSVQFYDPTVGEKPAEKWRAIFHATRKKFLDDTAEIPIALRSVRLRRLDLVCVRAQRSGNHMLVLASVEQAAKEVGELYTNKRNVGGVVGHINLDVMNETQLQHLANGGSLENLPR